MQIQIQRLNDTLSFRATGEEGSTITIDSAPDMGGTGEGIRPMQMVAMGLGGCSSIDVISILEKQRQQLDRYEVQIQADRREDDIPRVFETIHLRFVLEGTLDPAKVRRAIDLSLDKYCSVAAMLAQTATITYSFEVNGDRYE